MKWINMRNHYYQNESRQGDTGGTTPLNLGS